MSYIFNPFMYFKLANDAYRNNGEDVNSDQWKDFQPGNGWKEINMPDDLPITVHTDPRTGMPISRNNGYYGRAWYNPSTNDVVISHRGSQVELSDWLGPNVVIAMQDVGHSGWHPQFDSAHHFSEYVKQQVLKDSPAEEFKVVHTGHSLGGALAQIETARNSQHDNFNGRFKEESFTFDNPGVKQIITDKFGKEASNYVNNHSVEVLSPANIVNATGEHYQNVHRGEFPEREAFQIQDGYFGDPMGGGQYIGKYASDYVEAQMGHKLGNMAKFIDPATGLPRQKPVDKASDELLRDILGGKNTSSDPLIDLLNGNTTQAPSPSPLRNDTDSRPQEPKGGTNAPVLGRITTPRFNFQPLLNNIAQAVGQLHDNLSKA